MSGLNIQNSRLQQKYSTVTGATPTIAPSTDHTDGTWTENDLYVGELYINVQDDTMFYRSLNGIIPITSGTTTINTTTFVNKTGDTMTGPLFTTTLSANTISATTVYSPSFNGTFIGDGSQLTGITSTTFTGGTVSGPVIFTSDVNLCGAAVTVSELSGCGGTIDVYSVINALDAISATTFYGDGSGLTNLPYFSGLTLDEVLTLGDTSISGNIVLSGGNITLGSGVFYGDGSGLTNIPSSPIPTLDDVLTTGNISADSDILLTNGDIILGNGIFYGDGSGLTNIAATNDVFVTGGTYDNTSGTATFTNNTGATFTVTGFTTGSTSSQTLEETLVFGNTTNGNNIIISSGDTINSYDDIFKLDITNGRFIYEDANVTSKLDIGVDEINLEVYDTSINKRARIQTGLDGLGDVYAELSANDMSLGTYTALLIKSSGATIDSLYSGFKGIEYVSDYSANFVNRSLVDKEYVDNAISGFSTGYTYITEDTVAQTLVFSGANSVITTVTGIDNTDTLRVDGDEIRLTALGPGGQTNYLSVNRDIIANYASLEAVSNNYAYETLSPTQKNINIYDDTNAQSTYTLTQTSEISRIEDGSGGLSESNINASTAYLLNTAGEGINTSVSVDQNYAEMKQQEGSSVTRLQVSNDGFYKSQSGSTGISKGVSKTNFTSLQTIDDTPTTVVWPLSDLEVGTTAVGIKAIVTGINLADDKAYISELYAAVRMNAYAVVIFGGVDKLEKTEFTTATSTIDIESLNAAIIVTGEVGETIRWSVKYELIYAV